MRNELRTAWIITVAALALSACDPSANSPKDHPPTGGPGGSNGGGGAQSDGGAGGQTDGGSVGTSDGGQLPGADGGGTGADGGTTALPFQANTPAVYVAKVKNILTGLAPTDAEMSAVTADPTALGGLIDAWMKTPEYSTKMLRFFQLAFQQTQINSSDFSELIPNGNGIGTTAQTNYLVQNVEESLARTALANAAAGEPFTTAFTTHAFMMTPALMELYAFMDVNQVNNTERVTDTFATVIGDAGVTVESTTGPIPFANTIDPANPQFMHFYLPALTSTTTPACVASPRVYPTSADSAQVVYDLLYGFAPNFTAPDGTRCVQYTKAAPTSSLFTSADFTTWKMVTVRPPKPGEATTSFYNLPLLRTATELVLSTPRVGFFTTPAFQANWQTNASNQMRVTTNQALIVATNAQVDGTDSTVPPSTPGLDSAHASPGTACYDCHQLLDPTRSILQATYSYAYGKQTTAALIAEPGLFAFQGVIAKIATIDDFAAALSKHPLVPGAWVEKLCYYANSVPCAADDPEYQRIVSLFQSSNLSWNALVKALMESPITTNASPTSTSSEEGEVASVARRDHLCALLNARLGLTDVCALDPLIPSLMPTLGQIASGLPSDAYGRGAAVPLLPKNSSLFFRAATENLCEGIAAEIIDPAAPYASASASHYTGASPGPAINAFVSTLMGLTATDPRSSTMQTILTGHFQSAVSSGATATNALRSTFLLACLSPTVVGMGM